MPQDEHHDIAEGNDGDEDDDQIIVVSTTQQKWEKLHGIVENNDKNSALQDGGVEDEDVIIIQTKPARPMVSRNTATYHGYFRRIINALQTGGLSLSQRQRQSFVIIAIGAVALFLYKYRRRRTRKSLVPIEKDKEDIPEATTTTSKTVTAVQLSESTTLHDSDNQTTVTLNQQATIAVSSTSVEHCSKKDSADGTGNDALHAIQEQSTQQLLARQPSTASSSSENKLHLVRQMAQDIQLVQDVLKEHSLDPALAPQIAMTLQSSHHLVESQRELHYQQAVLNLHHRQLDRQLSERQHRESLQAIKYDPNWELRLEQQRQQCWNVSKNVTRLWWEFLLVQQVIRGILSIAWRYFGASSSEGENERVTNYNTLLWDMAWSVLSQVCDCHDGSTVESTDSLTMSTTDPSNATWTSWIAAAAVATSSTHNPLAIFMLLLKSWIPHSWIDLDRCTCYGYCLIAGCLLMMTTMALHHVLRALSLPAMLHHIVNLIAFATFYGAHRIVAGILNMMATMTSVSNMDTKGLAEFALMFLMLVLQPLFSYIKTQRLHHAVRHSVSKADASNFEDAFRRGQQQLKEWDCEQLVLRYLLFPVYAALLLSSGTGDETMIK